MPMTDTGSGRGAALHPAPSAGALIAVDSRQIADQAVQTIDSADLHAFLQVTTEHGQWIARRIRSYGFREGLDFVCSSEVTSKGRGGHNRAAYFITLDMAKQLAMVERGQKGRQARQYFIECERLAKAARAEAAPDIAAALSDPGVLRRLLAEQLDARLMIEHEAATQAPKAAAYDRLCTQQGAHSLSGAAKVLGIKPRQFNAWLHELTWIFRSKDYGSWQGYQRRLDEGFLTHRMHLVIHTDGRTSQHAQVLVTPKGLAHLALQVANASPSGELTDSPRRLSIHSRGH